MTGQTTDISEVIGRFNPAQKEAALGTLGPMLIIAGAGSGKTSVLTARIALLLSQGVRPERILALTFTKKAAEEMRSRIIAMEGDKARQIMMGTFHSVFIRFLRPYAPRLHFPENFTVLDEDDSLSCLKRCIREVLDASRPPRERWTKEMKEHFDEQDKPYKPKTIQGIISSCKNELVTADAYAADPVRQQRDADAKRPLTGKIFLAYRNACHRMSMMDFDDILLYTDILLANNPDVMAMIAGSYDYILVDEYQDTNYAQYSILRRLTWINKNICVVGDDSQSIYAFRGARIQNILGFKEDYPGCQVVKLEQNYRSTRNIVNAANNLIACNGTRIPKVCFTDTGKGEPLTIKTCDDEKDEARYVASTIKELRRTERKRWGDFAVLYRTNAQSRVIEDALVRERIPYTVYSGTAFFSRMEVKDLMAYFRLAVNPRDDEAFLRVINKPARGVGDTAKGLLRSIALTWNCSLWEAATNPQIQICGLQPRALQGLSNFIDNIRACMDADRRMDVYSAASYICDQTGFYSDAQQAGDEESRTRAENLRELVDSVKAYAEEAEASNALLPEGERTRADLAGYLQNVMLLSNADTGEDDGDKVSLMTVHCAKGLEFDTVFVTGMEKRLFPLEIDGDAFEEEEERRLFYVAMTRAKRELILTKAENRLRYGKRQKAWPSPFLRELQGKR